MPLSIRILYLVYQCTHKQSNMLNWKPISNSVNRKTLQLDMNCILLMGKRYKKWFGQIKLRSISPTCQGWLGPTAKWINATMIINIGNLSNKHILIQKGITTLRNTFKNLIFMYFLRRSYFGAEFAVTYLGLILLQVPFVTSGEFPVPVK